MNSRFHIYLVLAASVSALATDMIVPAIPDIQKGFDVPYTYVQLLISGFLIIYALSQLAAGFIGEKLGKLKVLTWSFLIFTAGSLTCFLAKDVNGLFIGRLIQALGAGAGPVLSRALAKDNFPEESLKKTLSDISSASAVVPLIAPLLGGFLLGYLNWNFIFLFMFIFGIGTVLLTPRELTSHKIEAETSSESFVTPSFITGTVLVSLMLSSLFCFISLSPGLFIGELKLSPLAFSFVFSASVLFFIIGNQLSKISFFEKPLFLFIINALTAIPFLLSINNIAIYLISLVIYNVTLGIYYPSAWFLSLKIKGNKTGIASAITGFTQTVSAGAVSLIFVSLEGSHFSFDKILGFSIFIMASVSLLVCVYKRKFNE
ncbi:MFS transporter [Winslowiella iniecta]|uniref:MFS transporter n=1 Tax=Winslowiella iniecta TaxID=1560201 RepID=A0A0L7T4M5_9GAMM|nr:MFS transporter [Winslowiella iniecta]KOC90161.1 MFS transporter [Winslowiella iniecta]KOC94155.1 MFS transporter [Winslowiella iniecta]